jgi:hypothetical protein
VELKNLKHHALFINIECINWGITMGKSIIDKIWDKHIVYQEEGKPD